MSLASHKGTFQNELKRIILDGLPEPSSIGDEARRRELEDYRNAVNDKVERLVDAIHEHIGNLQITIPSGAINVAGTAAAQSNPAPIILTGSTVIG